MVFSVNSLTLVSLLLYFHISNFSFIFCKCCLDLLRLLFIFSLISYICFHIFSLFPRHLFTFKFIIHSLQLLSGIDVLLHWSCVSLPFREKTLIFYGFPAVWSSFALFYAAFIFCSSMSPVSPTPSPTTPSSASLPIFF